MSKRPVPQTALEIRLASRPVGWPTRDNFDVVEVPVIQPGPDQVLVRNTAISVDPYMRWRMSDAKSYVAPFELGEAMDGGAVGEVVASGSERFTPGQYVLHGSGWREYALLDARGASSITSDDVPPSAYLGVLGMPGLTAYVGLVDKADFRSDDTVFVSGAAGAVGSFAGQLARLRGASRVIGSAGSDDKVRYLIDDLGFDAAFNYKDGPVADQLRDAAPGGIDVYFDNVGGDHLEAAIDALNDFGRIAACGAVSQYNTVDPAPGPRNLDLFIKKRLSMRGFIVSDSTARKKDFLAETTPWVSSGELRYRETIVEGLANAPDAFLGLLRGDNIGKMIVAL